MKRATGRLPFTKRITHFFYARFEGDTPKGHYGAGQIEVLGLRGL